METNLLTFCDYKILTKILSNRVKVTLPQTISKEQTCGITDRTIFSNIFTIREITTHSSTNKIKSYIMSVDQEKPSTK